MAEAQNKKEALNYKEKGNQAYSKKNFDLAIENYDKAIELDPNNITFYTNKAAVYFEMGLYDDCIELCSKSVDIGREHLIDFHLIAKAYFRMGNASLKKDHLEDAVRYYDKGLLEHREPTIVKKVVELNKKIAEKIKLAYMDPEKAKDEKEKGNAFFKDGNYPDALKHYNEAVKRNPDDAILFSNRAACYTKLMEFNLALKDCNECIRIDPKFLKGYLRKGTVQLTLKDASGARVSYETAMEIDPSNAEATEGFRKSLVEEGNDPEAIKKRAMGDPEIKKILQDPAMQLILQQMQSEPSAIREHLKNPDIANKISKLLECGIIAIR